MSLVWDASKIKSYDNFISESDALRLIAYTKEQMSLSSDQSLLDYHRINFPFAGIENNDIRDLLVELEKRHYYNFIQNYIPDMGIRMTELSWCRDLEIVRWNKGGLQEHRDGHPGIPDGMPEHKILAFSSLIYLTDDFTGGDLTFPEFDIVFKPKKFSLVTFPSFYLHGVENISVEEGQGARYTIPFFYGIRADEFGPHYHTKNDPATYEYGFKSLDKIVIA